VQDLQRFELLAQQMGQSDKSSDEYDTLLEKLIALDAFSIENKIISLLQQMALVSKKDDRVSMLSGGQQYYWNE
jgi:ATPase subunit of ABC transporter with duplicated ATPase domains